MKKRPLFVAVILVRRFSAIDDCLRFLTFIGIALLLMQLAANAQNPYSDSKNVGGWVLNEDISDEFEGTEVDEDKWHFQGTNDHYENRFKGRAPSQFVPANVSVGDGHLRITTRWQPDFDFVKEQFNGQQYRNITTGAIISRKRFLYGYLETRCKAANGPVSSSFWTTGEDGELDVFEHWGADTKAQESANRYHTSIHDWRKGSPTMGQRIWSNEHRLDFKVGEEFHVYGLEWAENHIKIFIDGTLVRSVPRDEIGDRWVVDNEQKVWFDSEVFPWEVDPATLEASDYPDDGLEFVVDYVRIWQRDGKGSDTNERPNLLRNPI